PVLEVGAGRGDLARALRERGLPVVATDDGSWLDGRRSWPGALPTDVEPLPYATALARYQPGIVLCAWMPLGEDWTPAFRPRPAPSGERFHPHADALGERLHDPAKLRDLATRDGREAIAPPHVRRQRLDLDLREVDPDADAPPTPEGGQRVRLALVLLPRRQV